MQFSDKINEIIGMSEIVVFSKPNCLYCDELKTYLHDHGVDEFALVDTNAMPSDISEDFIETVIANTDLKSFPICFMHGQYISVDDLRKKLTLSFKDDDIDNI